MILTLGEFEIAEILAHLQFLSCPLGHAWHLTQKTADIGGSASWGATSIICVYRFAGYLQCLRTLQVLGRTFVRPDGHVLNSFTGISQADSTSGPARVVIGAPDFQHITMTRSQEVVFAVICSGRVSQKRHALGLFAIFILHVEMGDINPPLPRLGFRFGEALNPGPGQHCEPHATTILAEFSVCALNPTAVLNKSRNILDIGANVYCLSETSATKFVQNEVDRQLAKPFRAHWGAAVEPRAQYKNLACARRGLSIGVAIWTSAPTRSTRETIPDWLANSGRYHECWIRIGHFDVLVICVYAKQGRSVEAQECNNILINAVLARAALGGPHVIVAGDFNWALHESPVSQHLWEDGFVDTLQWARREFPQTVGPTCNDVSYNDTILLKGGLLQHISGALVDGEHSFANHSPFVLKFRVPCKQFVRRTLRIPKDWTEFQFDSQAVSSHYQHDTTRATDQGDRVPTVAGPRVLKLQSRLPSTTNLEPNCLGRTKGGVDAFRSGKLNYLDRRKLPGVNLSPFVMWQRIPQYKKRDSAAACSLSASRSGISSQKERLM